MRSRWSARITNICNFCPAVPSWPSTVLERLWGSQVMPCVSLSACRSPCVSNCHCASCRYFSGRQPRCAGDCRSAWKHCGRVCCRQQQPCRAACSDA